MRNSGSRVVLCFGVCAALSISLPLPAASRARAAALHPAIANVGARAAAHRRTKLKHCEVHMVDDFQAGTGLMDVMQNTQVLSRNIAEDAHLQIPNHPEVSRVLQATPSSRTQGQTFGRDFVIPQNWSKASGIGFWYYGHRSGQSVDVELRANSRPDPGPSGWTLRWSDEFDGPAGSPPDPAVWGYDLGDGNGWGNHELEYYTNRSENVALDGQGHLVITARAEPTTTSLSCHYGPCRYTSARLLTQNRFEVGYGRIEARIKVPAGTGLWPAFWALGSNFPSVGWPQSGEIDVMENVGRQPNTVYGTAHGPGYSGANGLGATYTASAPLSDDFHTYAVEWTPAGITWTIDGIAYHRVTPADASPNTWVFNHPFFLLLNLAVGGDFGGAVDPNLTFPRSMLVDYVRVYAAPDTAERFHADFRDTFSGWKHISIPFSAFHRASQQPAGAATTRLSAKAVSGYSFTLPAGYAGPVLLSDVQTERAQTQPCPLD